MKQTTFLGLMLVLISTSPLQGAQSNGSARIHLIAVGDFTVALLDDGEPMFNPLCQNLLLFKSHELSVGPHGLSANNPTRAALLGQLTQGFTAHREDFLPAAQPKPLSSREIFFPSPGETLSRQNRRKPNEVGMDAKLIDRLKQALRASGIRWAIWRHGYLIYVHGDFNRNIEVKSLRKTWLALMVGAALQQKRIPSVNQKLSVWNKELKGNHALATWRHVITQTSGFDYPYGKYPAYKPGEMWTYSDKNPHHLCNALARAYGKNGYRKHFDQVAEQAYFKAIGMRGWKVSPRGDGIRFHFDLEDMGRLGLFVLARGQWKGKQLIPKKFVEQLETKQTAKVLVNYNGPDDGRIQLDPKRFSEAPYGFMTWVNTDGKYYPGADKTWAWGAGAGGTYILWNRKNGIVFAGVGIDTRPNRNGIPHIIESCITGSNPLLEKKD